MKGLKRVTRRRDDALTRVGWDHLETLLAAYYRSEGYEVEHVGTGATGARFDGGVDLKLRRGEQYIVVQCKHWNAMKVPHNAVHELLGLMVNHGATGAILATSGEFTKAAIEAAGRLGHVQLIDGSELRMMLGPVREPAPTFEAIRMRTSDGLGTAIAKRVGERLLSAAEDRVRHGRGARRSRAETYGFGTRMAMNLLALLLFLGFLGLMYLMLMRVVLRTWAPAAPTAPSPVIQMAVPASGALGSRSTQPPPGIAEEACRELIDRPSGTYIDHCAKRTPTAPTAPTSAERKLQQRDADAAIGVIADSTPEM